MRKKNRKKSKSWGLYLLLSVFALKKLGLFKKKHRLDGLEHNFKKFLKKEDKEIGKYTEGKENFVDFCRDAGDIFKDYFIPHQGNKHLPKIFHVRSLAIIAFLAAFIKGALLMYLFFVFPHPGQADELMLKQVLNLLNTERVNYSLKPLSLDTSLSRFALDKANNIDAENYFAHISPNGKKPWDWIDRSVYPYALVGENLAMNFSSAESVHRALIESPSHKRNILSEKYSDIGLAIIKGEMNGKATNILVELFAVKVKSAPEPVSEPKPEAIKKVAVVATETKREEPKKIVESIGQTKVLGIEASIKEEEKNVPSLVVKKDTPTKVVSQKTEKAQPKSVKIQKPIQKSSSQTFFSEQSNELYRADGTRVIKHPGDEYLAQKQGKFKAIAGYFAPKYEAISTNLGKKILTRKDRGAYNFSISQKLIDYSRLALGSIMSLLIIFLLINIVIRLEFQHRGVIVRAMVVVLFVAGLLTMNFHYLEEGLPLIYII